MRWPTLGQQSGIGARSLPQSSGKQDYVSQKVGQDMAALEKKLQSEAPLRKVVNSDSASIRDFANPYETLRTQTVLNSMGYTGPNGEAVPENGKLDENTLYAWYLMRSDRDPFRSFSQEMHEFLAEVTGQNRKWAKPNLKVEPMPEQKEEPIAVIKEWQPQNRYELTHDGKPMDGETYRSAERAVGVIDFAHDLWSFILNEVIVTTMDLQNSTPALPLAEIFVDWKFPMYENIRQLYKDNIYMIPIEGNEAQAYEMQDIDYAARKKGISREEELELRIAETKKRRDAVEQSANALARVIHENKAYIAAFLGDEVSFSSSAVAAVISSIAKGIAQKNNISYDEALKRLEEAVVYHKENNKLAQQHRYLNGGMTIEEQNQDDVSKFLGDINYALGYGTVSNTLAAMGFPYASMAVSGVADWGANTEDLLARGLTITEARDLGAVLASTEVLTKEGARKLMGKYIPRIGKETAEKLKEYVLNPFSDAVVETSLDSYVIGYNGDTEEPITVQSLVDRFGATWVANMISELLF